MRQTELTPNVGIGPFRLGQQVAYYVWKYRANTGNSLPDGHNEIHYDFRHWGIQLDVEGEIVISIVARNSCTFDGIELIGSRFDKLPEILGRPSRVEKWDIHDDAPPSISADFDELGVLAWASSDGLVESITLLG